MKSFNKVIFWIIIAVFVLSSFLAFASFSFITQPGSNNNEPLLISPEEKAKIEADEVNQEFGQSISGIVQKAEAGKYEEGTHYLQVDDAMILLLESDNKSIDLIKYEGKNVEVWGQTSMTQKNDAIIMKVTKIEVSS